MKRAACTIVSANYLHFAWTLAESFFKFHPNDEFHLLLVDKMPADFVLRDSRVHVLAVEDLGLPSFRSLAFKFDVLELNTAVKPTFLKYLLARDIDKVIYFDPDIYIFQSVDFIFEKLEQSSIVLTPHILSPTCDKEHLDERALLRTGVFNLGFVAINHSPQTDNFLDWWEERCLRFGFQDLWAGLFVDQKWIDLVPCLFEGFYILRHVGCNVAYWNLHERTLSGGVEVGYQVNETSELIFFHYSGYSVNSPDRLSSKLRHQRVISEPLRHLLGFYRECLIRNGADLYQKKTYSFATFSDGSPIPLLARRLYSTTLDVWNDADPFDVQGQFYLASKKAGILSKRDRAGLYNSSNMPKDDWRIKAINRVLFSLPKVIGGERYAMLMKYFSFISILRHQRQLLLHD